MYIAYASSSGTATGFGGSWTSILIIVVMFAALYFFTIRPQSKRDKELKNLRNNLRPGDEIITIGGIYGKIVRVTDDRVVIAVGSEKTKIEMAKSAISGFANGSTSTASSSASSSKTREAEEPVKETKPSPKNIRKLGAAKKDEEALAAEAAEILAEAAKEEAAEKAAEAVEAAAGKTE